MHSQYSFTIHDFFILLSGLLCFACSDDSSDAVNANFEITTDSVFVGERIFFIDKSSGEPTHWSWIFEEGNPKNSIRQNPFVIFNKTGSHRVTLTVSNQDSEDTFARQVEVHCKDANSSATFTNYIKTENLVYSIIAEEHLMDIYEPVGDDRCDRPAIVLLVGGGVGSPNDLSSMGELAISMALRGYIVGVAQYRSGSTEESELYLRMLIRNQQDAKAAVRYLKSEAGNYRIDTDLVFIGGHGSGATIGLVAAYLTADEIPQEEKSIFVSEGGLEGSLGLKQFTSTVAGAFSSSGAIYDPTASPMIIDAGEVPVFAVHAENDIQIPPTCIQTSNGTFQCGGQAIINRAQAVDIYSQLHLIPEGSHSLPRLSPELYMDELITFFEALQ